MSVAAVACRDRAGQPYEITLELARDAEPFAAVGERCGYRLAQLAERVRAARRDPEQAQLWPDPDDRFPAPSRRRDYRPGESEYFCLRSRDRGDPAGTGELRCTLRSSAEWIGECGGGRAAAGPGRVASVPPRQRSWPGVRAVLGQHRLPGRPDQPERPGRPQWRGGGQAGGCWRLTRRAVLEAWGESGIGVRAVLTSAELVSFLDNVLTQPDGSVLATVAPAGGPSAGRTSGTPAGSTAASRTRGGHGSPAGRGRERTPDESARSGLPALRAEA
ncbi:MAG TPA: hypothetical protein VFV41_18670 [Streptosporangiaceae bacterium]|nr:hypothetical protein [Streptosporangiaceae bacterium]